MSSVFLRAPEYTTIRPTVGSPIMVPTIGGITVAEHENYVGPHASVSKIYALKVAVLAYKLNTETDLKALSFDDCEALVRNPDTVEARACMARFPQEWSEVIAAEDVMSEDKRLALMMIRRVEPDFHSENVRQLDYKLKNKLVELAYQEIKAAFPDDAEEGAEEESPKKD